MSTKVTSAPSTKTAHIGRTAFKIPAQMTMATMALCWQDDSNAFQALAKSIVDFHPQFAYAIVYAYCEKHNQRLADRDPVHEEKLFL
jgi:hypothetical protein